MNGKLVFDNLNLNDRVYLYLRDQIINNVLQPGSKIEYGKIMEELGVSRTPLRDAMNRLQHDKLIEIKPRSGTHVSIPTRKDIKGVYDVRKVLEILAIEAATHTIPLAECKRLFDEADIAEEELKKGNLKPFYFSDRSLHQAVIKYSNNNSLIEIMNTLEVQIKWFGILMTVNHERPFRAIAMHRKIIRAMHDRQVDDAKALMEKHIEAVREDILTDFPDK